MKTRRWVGWLLRLYPEAFREAHRTEVEEHVDSALRDGEKGSVAATITVAWDLCRSALRLRLKPIRRRTSRSRSGAGALSGWLGDLRVACRALSRRPGFSFVVSLTLALGVGMNTALFSVVNVAILQPFDYDDPDRLVYLAASLPGKEIEDATFSGGDLEDLREVPALARVEGVTTIRQNLHGAGLPRQVTVGWVSGGFLDMLGVDAVLGRVHTPEDPPGLVVLSYGLWQTAFDRSPDVLGRTIELDGHPYTVIGAMPEGFRAHLPSGDDASPRVEVWKNPDDYWQNGDTWSAQGPEFALIQAVGRLRTDAGIIDAQAGVDRVAADLRSRFPSHEADGLSIGVALLHDRVVEGTRPILLMLLAAVAAVLLIACANVANLLLVRGHARRREIALRVALGSSRGRVGRFLMLESVVLTAVGTGGGILLAIVAIDLIPRFAPPGMALVDQVRLDTEVLGFASAVAVLVVLLVGLFPTMVALRGDPAAEMSGTRIAGFGGAGFRRGLVVVQLSLSLVLLVGAGLLVSSVAHLQEVDVGFDPTDVYTFGVSIPGTQYGWPEEAGAFYREVEARIELLPGVEAAGVVWPMPFSGGWSGSHSADEGEPRPLGQVPYRLATEGYFPMMGIPLGSGRLFTDGDRRNVAVISERVAERAWPGERAIGRMIQANPWGGGDETFEVIGVVGDLRYGNLREPSKGAIYFDARSWSWVDWEVHVLARTSVSGAVLLPQIREVVADLDATVPVAHPALLEDGLRAQTADSRFVLALLGAFAATAALLALVGLYGVVAYSVGLRRREFGVRIALGSGRAGIRSIVLREGGKLVAIGVGVGLVGAWLTSRTLESLLFEVSATDPMTFVAVSVLLALGAGAASWIPAWRVGRMDPADVLRAD